MELSAFAPRGEPPARKWKGSRQSPEDVPPVSTAPEPSQPAPASFAKRQEVTLGCGTLILFALIVMIFSRRDGTKGLERDVQRLAREVQSLRSEVSRLRAAVSEQTSQVQALRSKLTKPIRSWVGPAHVPMIP
jgi:hypothetical protein